MVGGGGGGVAHPREGGLHTLFPNGILLRPVQSQTSSSALLGGGGGGGSRPFFICRPTGIFHAYIFAKHYTGHCFILLRHRRISDCRLAIELIFVIAIFSSESPFYQGCVRQM